MLRQDRPIRIALFLPSLEGGGAERVMLTLANAISARGYAVDIVLASMHGPYLSGVSRQIRVIDLKAGRVSRSLLRLSSYLRRERPDVLLSGLNHANVVATMARHLAGTQTRLVLTEHSTISEEAARTRGLAARAVYTLVRRLYPHADQIVAVSQAAARDLEQFTRLPAGTVRTIYNPFDLQGIREAANQEPSHPWLAQGQPPVILAMGRLTEAKDFPTLIRAFAAIHARHHARLLILGEGALRGNLEALVQEMGMDQEIIQMPGFVTNPYACLSHAALFVLSSRWEGLPGVLIEAMACGTPVISTDCPSGPREILEHGAWGRLVPVGDVTALAQAMDATLGTPRALLPEVQRRARDFAQELAVEAYLEALGLSPWPERNPPPGNAGSTA